MEQKRIKNRATNVQIKFLLNYMASNKIFASGRLYGPVEDAEETREKEWNSLRALLRKHGPDKTVRQWKTTWRDLKRKMRRLKIDAKTLAETINVNTDKPIGSETMVKLNNAIKHESSDDDTGIEHESSTDLDPLEASFNGYTIQSGVSIKEEPPMQVFVTNVDPPSNKLNAICGHENCSSTLHCHCCRWNVLPRGGDTVRGNDNLQAQRNVLLQNLCNLLEEQNSILRMRNRIERHKIRYQKRRSL